MSGYIVQRHIVSALPPPPPLPRTQGDFLPPPRASVGLAYLCASRTWQRLCISSGPSTPTPAAKTASQISWPPSPSSFWCPPGPSFCMGHSAPWALARALAGPRGPTPSSPGLRRPPITCCRPPPFIQLGGPRRGPLPWMGTAPFRTHTSGVSSESIWLVLPSPINASSLLPSCMSRTHNAAMSQASSCHGFAACRRAEDGKWGLQPARHPPRSSTALTISRVFSVIGQ